MHSPAAEVGQTQTMTEAQIPSADPVDLEQEAVTWFTIKELATATGASESTIKRRHGEERFPNAKRSDGKDGKLEGTWLIPTSDLTNAGLALKVIDLRESFSGTSSDLVHDLNPEPQVDPYQNQVQRDADPFIRELNEAQQRRENELRAEARTELEKAHAKELENRDLAGERATLESQLAERDRLVQEKDERLREKDEQLQDLAVTKEREIARLLEDRDRQLAAKDQHISHLDSVLEVLQEKRPELYASDARTSEPRAALSAGEPRSNLWARFRKKG
jgi:hypothetical protein